MRDSAVSIKGVKKDFQILDDKEDSIKLKILNTLRGRGSKKRGVHRSLKGIDLEIKKGEFIGILGRNGAGKSTLLKIIAEIYKPTKGSVKVNGKLVPFIELGVGFNPNLTGRDNVYLNGAMLGFSNQDIDSMYDSIVTFAELEDFMDQKLKNYSSGMQVRLAFSLAIRANADILLLDEVLAVGDAAFQQKCYEYFDSLKDSKKTIILVSHSLGVIRKYCDRAVLIDDGRVAYDGTAEEVANRYLDLFGIKPKTKPKPKLKTRWKEDKLDGKVKISDVRSVCTPDQVVFDIELVSNTKQEGLKLAIRILNKKKWTIAGINTQSVINPVVIDLTAKQSKIVRLTMPNILGNGTFSVDVRVGPMVYTGTIHDKVNDIAHFTNKRDEVYYPIALPAKVEVDVK